MLHIDWNILKESKQEQKNLAISWIECRKAYDITQQTCGFFNAKSYVYIWNFLSD